MTPAVELRGVTKDFVGGDRGRRMRAIDALDLAIAPGEVFGLLGPNGSGKSTTLKLILGLVEPTQGECRVFGVPSSERTARGAVGYLPEAPYFHRFLTGRELVMFHGRLSGGRGRTLRTRVGEVIEWAGLTTAADRAVGSYSKGMLQRIGMAQALVGRPRLVILDEPTAGVDAAGTSTMLTMIRRLKAEGMTVLLTSHLLGQVEQVCDRVAVLVRGRLEASGRFAEITGQGSGFFVSGAELSPEDQASLANWLGRRGCAIVAADFGVHRFQPWLGTGGAEENQDG